MKQLFTHTFYAKKIFRSLLVVLILLVAMPVIEAPQAEAQTKKTGNFFTKRFKRKNKFKRKSKNKTAFQRKPFSCEDIGKTKVAQIKVSKKQLRKWEQERQVKAQQEELKQQRQAKNNTQPQEKNIILSASSNNNIKEVATQNNNKNTEENNTKIVGWYSSEKPNAPKILPIKINQENKIISEKNKKELETITKYSRLGYTIILESNNKKQLETVKNYLISSGAEKENLTIKFSSLATQNEVSIKIEN